MQVLIYGAGAIGAWLAAGLSRTGHDVSCIARQAFIDAVNRDGLLIEQADGVSSCVTGIKAYPSLEALHHHAADRRPEGFDAILFCVKAYSMQAVMTELLEWEQCPGMMQTAKPYLICFQNGVGSDDVVANAFGGERVVAATTTAPVSAPAPGMLKIQRSGGAMCLAPLGNVDVTSLATLFRDVIPTVKVYRDYRSLRWSKLLLNIMGNASSAILDMAVEDIYGDQRTYRMEMAMLLECIEVVKRSGIHFANLPHYPAAALAWAVKVVPTRLLQHVLRYQIIKGRGAKRPSLNYDVMNRTGHSEIEWLNGAVEKYGKAVGVQTPVNKKLTRVLSSIVNGDATQQEWRNNINKLVGDT